MTAVTLKWIALFTMIIDHIGLVFFPQYEIFRIIGRVSFPIFAFLLSQGFIHTSSRFKYILRLALFAVIAEVPFDLCVHGSLVYWGQQSIMIDMLIAFLGLIFLEAALQKNFLYLFGVAIMLFANLFANASYGVYGFAIIMLFYLFRKTRGADNLAFIGATYLFYGITHFGFYFLDEYHEILTLNSLQLYACIAAIALAIYSGKEGKKTSKWTFYIVYPLHLLVLWAINSYILPLF